MSSKNAFDTANDLTLNEVVRHLKRCIKVQRPAFLWGGPGLGKSSIVSALSKELGGTIIDVRLSQMDPTDIKGIPFYNKEQNTMSWAPPEMLPSEDFAKQYPLVILFLDEMNGAPPSVQAAAYQLVLDRRVGTYSLPDNVCIVAAGNRETDRGVTFRMPAPLANRFIHFGIKPDFDSWLDWAIPAHINSDIIAYLTSYRHKLYEFDATSPDKSFPTPRSYEFASQLISTDEDESPLSDSEIRELMTATVGAGTATEYMAYLKVGRNLPKPGDILSGKVKEIKTTEVSAHYQIIVAMLHMLREFWNNNSVALGTFSKVSDRQVENRKWNSESLLTDWMGMFDNFNSFILSQVALEIGVMAERMAFKNYNLQQAFYGAKKQLTHLKSWNEINMKFAKYILPR